MKRMDIVIFKNRKRVICDLERRSFSVKLWSKDDVCYDTEVML